MKPPTPPKTLRAPGVRCSLFVPGEARDAGVLDSLGLDGSFVLTARVETDLPYGFAHVADLLRRNEYLYDDGPKYRLLTNGAYVMSDPPYSRPVFTVDGAHYFCATREVAWFVAQMKWLVAKLSVLREGNPDALSSFFRDRPRLRRAITGHYEDGDAALKAGSVREMRDACEASDVARRLFLPPREARHAYRVLAGAPTAVVSGEASREPWRVEAHGPGEIRPLAGRKTSSWSDSASAVLDFASDYESEGWVVVLRARMEPGRFWFNPDLLPFYAGAIDVMPQREVAGVGTIAYEAAASFLVPRTQTERLRSRALKLAVATVERA